VLSDYLRSVASFAARLSSLIAMLCLRNIASAASSAPSDQLIVTMLPEIRVVERHGKDQQVRYLPAKVVEQGQEIYYTVRIVNATNEKVRRAAVIQQVPANTRLVDKSVTGAGAALSYSIDGGKTFFSLAELRNNGSVPASPRVTHIRWQFRHPLAPHVVVLARFRVVFD
jgi:uncharacterized repeat protein (TIGR01451 family)